MSVFFISSLYLLWLKRRQKVATWSVVAPSAVDVRGVAIRWPLLLAVCAMSSCKSVAVLRLWKEREWAVVGILKRSKLATEVESHRKTAFAKK
jgi:hypothetical protein